MTTALSLEKILIVQILCEKAPVCTINHTCCKPGHQTPQGEHLVYGT